MQIVSLDIIKLSSAEFELTEFESWCHDYLTLHIFITVFHRFLFLLLIETWILPQ